MSSASPHVTALLSTYGRLALRLATAIVGDDETARLVVEASARECEHAGDDRNDWAALLDRVRRESLRRTPRSRSATGGHEPPAPRHPGDVQTAALPVDAALLHEAFFSLADADRAILWTTLLGCSDSSDPTRLAAALARLREAVTRTGFPSAEDIP
ncbi:MAG: hypothetical protein ACOC6J_03710 [Spirochaetota bacterium]